MLTFRNHESIFFYIKKDKLDNKKTYKIAAFDFDNTIVRTRSGKNYSYDKDDWQFNYETVPKILKDYLKDKYIIVLFSNQSGIQRKTTTASEMGSKINNVKKALEINFDAMFASCKDSFRKPFTGMWDFWLEKKGLTMKNIDLKKSFYCGDAAGRFYQKEKKKKRRSPDFSDSDKNFANNIGLNFKLPEEIFKQEIPEYFYIDKYQRISFNDYFCNIDKKKKSLLDSIKKYNFDQEVIMLVGRPASGKTSFVKKYFPNHLWINQDTLRTHAKCIKQLKISLDEGKSVIIDNTNPSRDKRKKFIDVIKMKKILRKKRDFKKESKYMDIPIRIFYFDCSLLLNYHLNNYRVQSDKLIYKKKSTIIPQIAYRVFNKNYDEPKMDEGFTQIVNVPFIPDFKNDKKKCCFLNFRFSW